MRLRLLVAAFAASLVFGSMGSASASTSHHSSRCHWVRSRAHAHAHLVCHRVPRRHPVEDRDSTETKPAPTSSASAASTGIASVVSGDLTATAAGAPVGMVQDSGATVGEAGTPTPDQGNPSASDASVGESGTPTPDQGNPSASGDSVGETGTPTPDQGDPTP